MVYIRLFLAMVYWTLVPRKLLASPLPLWGVSWFLMAATVWAVRESGPPEHTILFNYSPTLNRPMYEGLIPSLKANGDWAGAEYVAKKIADSPTLIVLGMTDVERQNITQADNYTAEIARMWKLMEEEPKLRDGWLYLGWLELNFGSTEKARWVWERLQGMDPNHPEVLKMEMELKN